MTTQAPPKCNYEYQAPQEGSCKQEQVLGDPHGFCILHSQNLQKDRDEFQRAAADKVENRDYNFQGCMVPDGVTLDFSKKEFTGRELGELVDFSHSRWHGDARANFSGAQLHGDAWADFTGAQFHDGARANFSGAQFHENAWADFFGAQFHDGAGADFREAQFHDEAWAHFFGAQFHDRARADLISARFQDLAGADFTRAQFHDRARADFDRAQFHQGTAAIFSSAHLQQLYFPVQKQDRERREGQPEGFFGGVADFRVASFGQRTVFDGCQFAEGTTFARTDLENLAFRGCNLAGVSFRGAWHLAEAEFEDIRWGKLADVVGRPVVWDEGKARESNKSEDYAAAERVYRELKQSYERRGDYPRGADFYYGEMEMRRQVLPGAQRDFFSVLGLYWQLSGYGLQWHKAVIWFFLIVVPYFALFYMLAGFPVLQPGRESMGTAEALAHALSLSLGAMLLQVPDTFATSSIWG